MGLRIFLSILLLASPLTGASEIAANVSDVLKLSMGDQTEKVESALLQKQFSAEPGNTPEQRLLSGDVMLFLDTADHRAREAQSGVPPMPETYERGLQGLGHAAMVAKENNRAYRLESPSGGGCPVEFRGEQPYIVVRPKAKVSGDPKRFQKAVDDLADSFNRIGYRYNPTFKTSVLSWSPEAKAAFRGELKRYQLSPDSEKPNIPDMYCSELPITIHSLLGIVPRQSITMGEMIQIGLNSEIKKGKDPLQVVNETAESIINAYVYGYQQMITGFKTSIADSIAQKLPDAAIQPYREELDALKKSLEEVFGLKDKLKRALMVSIGIDPNNQCESAHHDVMGTLKENLAKILEKIDALPYRVILNRQVFRPVDFLKDSLSPGGNYQIVGYYPGNLPSSAACQVEH